MSCLYKAVFLDVTVIKNKYCMKINDTGKENVISNLILRFEKLYSAQQALSFKDINTYMVWT